MFSCNIFKTIIPLTLPVLKALPVYYKHSAVFQENFFCRIMYKSLMICFVMALRWSCTSSTNEVYFNVEINDTIEELDLSWNHLRFAGADAVADGLAVSRPRLNLYIFVHQKRMYVNTMK